LLTNSNYSKKYYFFKRKEGKKFYIVRSILDLGRGKGKGSILDLGRGKGKVRSVLNRQVITKCSIWQEHSKCSD